MCYPEVRLKKGETPEQAVIREMKEETNLDLIDYKRLFELKDDFAQDYYFIAKKFKGNPKIIGPELEQISKDNIYELEWICIDKLSELVIYPPNSKTRIITECSKIRKKEGAERKKKIK